MIIDTTIGQVDTRLLAIKGGATWTEYRLNGKLIRRDASAKLRGAKIKGRLKFGLRADFEHPGVEEDN